MTKPVRRKSLFILAASVAVLLASSGAPARADDGTWLGGNSSIWSDGTNWTSNPAFPNGAGDTATFDNNAASFTPTISGTDPIPNITVGNITFGSTATQAFTINVTGTNAAPASLTIDAAGITNSSSFTQKFAITGGFSTDAVAPTPTAASGSITFSGSASAGNNTSFTLTNGAGMYFNGSSSAGINTTYSTDTNSAIYFSGTSNGTTTSAFTNNGKLDISQQSGGVTVGGISGAGQLFLGGNNLNVNIPVASPPDTYSGVIQDGGAAAGTGGSLTVNGPGTLILQNTNTYTGNTTLNSGTLFLDSVVSTGSAVTNALGPSGTLIINFGGNPTIGTHLEPTGTAIDPSTGLPVVLSTGVILPNNVSVLGSFSVTTNSDPGAPGNQNFTFGGTVILNDEATNTITGTTAAGQIHFSGQIISSIGSPSGPGGITLADASGVYTAFIYDGSVANTYTGLTTVDQNAFLVLGQQTVANGAVVGDILVNPGGVAELFGLSNQIAITSNVTDNSTGINLSGLQFQGFELRNGVQTINNLFGNGTVGLGSGTLTLSGGNFSGNIIDGAFGSGGNIVKNSARTFVVSGVNTYTGTTTVNAGVFQAGSSTGFSPNSAFAIASAATLDVNGFNPTVGSLAGAGLVTNTSTTPGVLITGFNSTSTTFTGSVQDGAGQLGLVKTGFGTQTLTNSTYSGPTAVVLGILQAGSTTGFSPTSAYTVSAPGALDINGFNNSIGSLGGSGTVSNQGATIATLTTGLDNTNTTFSGTIQDSISPIAIVKTGTGAMTLSSSNTFTGGLTLQSGSIIVQSVLALGAGNVTVNGGTLKAGGNAIDIQVAKNYTQTGGELDLRLGGTTAGSFDRLAVVGSATLGGRLNLTSINGFVPTRGTSITIVDTSGGVTGQFQQVTGDFSNLQHINLTLDYEPNDVILEFTGTSFSAISGLTPNQKAVATALDNVILNDKSNKLLDYLNALPNDKSLRAAFDRIAPEEYATIYQISTSSAKIQASSVESRLDAVHGGPVPAGAGGPVGPADPNSPAPPTQPDALFGVYANTSGEFVSIGNSTNAAGYNFNSGAVTMGADYRFDDGFVAGVLLNYTRTRADLVDNGRLDADGIRGGIYASLFGSGMYVNGFIGAGYNDYGMNRQGLDDKVRGNTNGGEFNSFVQAGYDTKVAGITVGPVAAINYTYTGLSSFQEQGSLDPLSISSYREQSVRTNIGVRATYQWHLGKYIIAPEIRATWQHEYADVMDSVTASMLFGSPRFTVNSTPFGRDSILLNVGFTLTITPTLVAYLYYDGELARTNYQANNFMMGFRLDF